jgi:transposase-like protein
MSELKIVEELFKGRHFDREVIILCVRWYLRFKVSLRDLVEMMAERGLSMAHTTIMRWVQRYAPEFEKRWRQFARAAGRSFQLREDEPVQRSMAPPHRITSATSSAVPKRPIGKPWRT